MSGVIQRPKRGPRDASGSVEDRAQRPASAKGMQPRANLDALARQRVGEHDAAKKLSIPGANNLSGQGGQAAQSVAGGELLPGEVFARLPTTGADENLPAASAAVGCTLLDFKSAPPGGVLVTFS